MQSTWKLCKALYAIASIRKKSSVIASIYENNSTNGTLIIVTMITADRLQFCFIAECFHYIDWWSFFIAWKNIRLFATPSLVSSRNDVQETSAVIRNWSCNWLVETNFQPIRSTTQIWVSFLRRHFVGKSVVGSRNVACFRRLFFFSKASSTILRKSTIFIALFTNAGSHGCSFLKIICFINSVINLPARPASQTNELEVYYWRSSKVWSHSFCSLLLFTWH